VAIPRSLWWLLVTGLIVLALVVLSMLALDKPNAVWADGVPHCPHCRHDVPFYAHRCQTCREEFDWVATPEEDSPVCESCLLEAEAEIVKSRAAALGADAPKRVAEALEVSPQAAVDWLQTIKPGACGWCGGTGRDLAPSTASGAGACPCCFAEKDCVACAGDRRVHVGVEAADRDVRRAWLRWNALGDADGVDGVRRALRRDEERLVQRHAGALEASTLPFWPEARLRTPAETRVGSLLPGSSAPPHAIVGRTIAAAARARVAAALQALRR
jgi:hypothetical protein